MPPHLPVELLRLILDNFACPPMLRDGTLVNLHRHELLSLCLTSKIFRQIAQPLLFAVIRLEEIEDRDAHNEEGIVRSLVKQLLETGKQNSTLSNVRTVFLKGKAWDDSTTMPTGLLADLSKACKHLKVLLSNDCILELNSLANSSLRKLCINNANLEDQDISFCLPYLDSLSIVDVNLPVQGFGSINFPSLRHFAYDNSVGALSNGAGSTLVALAPQLISIVLVFDIAQAIIEFDSTFPLHSVLVDYLSQDLDRLVDSATDQIIHARIRAYVPPTDNPSGMSEGVNGVSRVIEDHTKFRKLKSIYLPWLDSLETFTRPISVRQAVDRLIYACQKRNIEIVHEEPPHKVQAGTQLSEKFMTRRSMERVERETGK